MDKGAVQYLVEECSGTEVLEVNGRKYSDKQLVQILEPSADTLAVKTLTAMVDYIQSNFDKREGPLLVKVDSPTKVVLLGQESGPYRQRDLLMLADCADLLPDMRRWFGEYVGNENFQIWLRSGFAKLGQRDEISELVSQIVVSADNQVDDNGVSQNVTVKTGIKLKDVKTVPNPVNLAPYRTFNEIEQPISEFLFRVNGVGQLMLKEADGGAWRAVAVGRIKEWLTEQLKDVKAPAITIIC